MPLAKQNKFDGGHAEDLRTFATDESEYSKNFDIFTNPHKLIPYPDSVAETVVGTMDDIELDFVEYSLIAGTYYLTASGYKAGGSSVAEFFTKDATDSSSGFNPQADGPAGVYQKGSAVVYKDKYFALSLSGTTWTLIRYDSGGVVTNIDTVTSAGASPFVRPFVHPEDNVLYGIIGTTIFSWDGTTFTKSTTLIPAGKQPVSMTDYGTYLAIAMKPLRGTGNSVVYLWGRDMTLNTFQQALDFGEGSINILENLNNDLIGVMQSHKVSVTGYEPSVSYLIVKVYSGGQIQTIRQLSISTSLIATFLKLKNRNRLYFGFAGDDCVYTVGQNKEGRYIIAKERYLLNGTTAVVFQGLAMIGDILWTGVSAIGTYVFMRTKTTATYANTSVYKTTINPDMPIDDRGKMKQLKAFRIYYTGKSSGTITVKYAVDTSTMTSILSETTAAAEEMKQTTMQVDGLAFTAGREIQFQLESTGGVEIKYYEYEYDFLNQ